MQVLRLLVHLNAAKQKISGLLICVFLYSNPVSAELTSTDPLNSLSEPRYLLAAVYGFEFKENTPPNLGRVRSVYLPNGTLVYPLTLDENDRPRGIRAPAKFGPYVTQYGQIVILPHSEVSSGTFRQNRSGADVIFHQDSYGCSSKDNLRCSEDDQINIAKSWASKTIRDPQSGAISMPFYIEGEATPRVAHFSSRRFSELKAAGVVSDLTESWPRYALVRKHELISADKPCGVESKVIDKSTLEGSAGIEAEIGLLDWFKLQFGASFTEELQTQNVIISGPAEVAIKLFELWIATPDTNGRYSDDEIHLITVAVQYECGGFAANQKAYNFRSMIVVNQDTPFAGRRQVSVSWDDVYDNPIETRDAEYIWDKNRLREFVFSVNSSFGFEQTLRKVQQLTEFDVALAHVMISAFNASCDGGARARCAQLLGH